MRWLFLLLVVLNLAYYGWSQQDAPVRVKEIAPLSGYKGGQNDIRLLSESQLPAGQCVYLGGLSSQDSAALERRLSGLSIGFRKARLPPPDLALEWLRIAPADKAAISGSALQKLSSEFKDLKHKIMPCEGIATGE